MSRFPVVDLDVRPQPLVDSDSFRLRDAAPLLVITWPGPKGGTVSDVFVSARLISRDNEPDVVLRLRGRDWSTITRALALGVSDGHDPQDLESWRVEYIDQHAFVCWSA